MNTLTGNSLIALSLLLTVAVPTATVTYLANRKRKAALQIALETTAQKNGLSLTRVNYLDGKVIGWDQQKRILLFSYLTNEHPTIIDLNPISRCYVLRKKNSQETTAITLQMADSNNRVRHSVPFYEQFTDSKADLKKFDTCSREWEHLLNKAADPAQTNG